MADKTLRVTAAQIEESVERLHNHSNFSVLDSITSSKINEWDNKSNGEHTHTADEIEGLDNLNVDLSNYYTKAEVNEQIANAATGGTVDLSGYVTEAELNNKNFATETFVTNKIAEASLSGGNVDLSGYATKDDLNNLDIPTKISQLTNDSNFIKSEDISQLESNLTTLTTKLTSLETSITNLIASNTTLASKVTALETKVAELDLQLNPPIVEYMYYGRLSASDVGIPPVKQFSEITEAQIKKGVADGVLTRTTPSTLGKTSMGLASDTAAGDYIIVIVPKSKNYTVTKDNGIGGKAIWNEETAGANGIDLTVDGVECTVWGEIILSQSELFIYID